MNNIFLQSEQWCARQPRWVMWFAVALWYGFITYLSHIPTSSSASTKNLVGGDDSLNAAFRFCAHLGVFGVLGILMYLAWQREFTFVPTSFCVVLCLVCLAGIIDEVHQYTVPGRFARVQDVVTDTLGASIALVVLTGLKRRVGI
jgi:glycopeptide antibiotics resistance protein